MHTDLQAQAAATLRARGLKVETQVPAARLGYWRIGGPVDLFVEVEDLAGLRAVAAAGLPVTVLGMGSNLLVADAGIRGITVRLAGALREVEVSPDGLVVAGGGARNLALLQRVDRAGFGGFGALAGVPGTMGGAIRMNAGTSLGWIGERVEEVELVLPGGDLTRMPARALRFGYRHAELPLGAIVSRVWLRAESGDLESMRSAVAVHLARRRATQPLDQPSCGSVFKNPAGDHAGRLIEAVGLKGAVEGGAQVSPLHANFIVNTGGASAADVHALVNRCRDRVYEEAGVLLEPEVHPAGDWPAGAWPLPSP